jgi:acetyl-CoA carboxylase biotin carboxyl carrier protein
MIDIRKLKELVRLMVANDLSELDLRDSEEQVTLRRPQSGAVPTVHVAPMAPAGTAVATAPAPVTAAPAADGAPQASADEGSVQIDSPMVGTYFAAPDPDSGPFVKAGDTVTPETVMCIIEAMKIFNEIKAECSGTVLKALVKNGEAVEFGQPLFVIKPD